MPLGGVVISDAIAATFDERVYPGGLTYSGHPLACAAAVATIETMQDEGIVENAARLGREVFGPGLDEDRRASTPASARCAALGVFWAHRAGPRPGDQGAAGAVRRHEPGHERVVAACKAAGLLPFVNYNRIHVVPPLTISDDDARRGLEIIDAALDVADAG